MLRPLKTFLTYLQKNASSASIFGLSSNMNAIEEPILNTDEIIPLEGDDEEERFNDPPTDPLALDDEYYDTVAVNNELDKDNNFTSLIELNESTDDKIIIVDVNALKKGVSEIISDNNTTAGSETEADDILLPTKLNLEEIIIEDSEIRSDGSDSGLGSEAAVSLPATNIPVVETVPTKSTLKRKSLNDNEDQAKRSKRSIQFERVTVYYFPRIQGFICVPSQGGCTLGMGSSHMHIRSFTMSEHMAEQRRIHRLQLQEMNPRSSSSEDTDSDDEASINSGSDFESESHGFLQPVSTKQRRALLKAAGVRKIESSEKDECRIIRTSREVCGCNCRGYCDPDTCSCSQSGIKCQVDRTNFPCGCTRDGCANVVGRIEFNPGRVRTHFIHTIMRLEMEKKQTIPDDTSLSTNVYNRQDWLPQVRLSPLSNTISNGQYTNMMPLNHTSSQLGDHMTIIEPLISSSNVIGNSNAEHLFSHISHSSMRSETLQTVNTVNVVGAANESLDLHYAFRDDYTGASCTNIVGNSLSHQSAMKEHVHPEYMDLKMNPFVVSDSGGSSNMLYNNEIYMNTPYLDYTRHMNNQYHSTPISYSGKQSYTEIDVQVNGNMPEDISRYTMDVSTIQQFSNNTARNTITASTNSSCSVIYPQNCLTPNNNIIGAENRNIIAIHDPYLINSTHYENSHQTTTNNDHHEQQNYINMDLVQNNSYSTTNETMPLSTIMTSSTSHDIQVQAKIENSLTMPPPITTIPALNSYKHNLNENCLKNNTETIISAPNINKELSNESLSTDIVDENLSEIIKKSIVETVSS